MTAIFVESKKTDRVDFVKPLRKYIQNQYNKDQATAHEPILNDYLNLREDLRLNTEKTESAREKHVQYYGFLNCLERHFAINERGVKINFYWYDSVSKKRAAQYDLEFERACIQFNIGAIESQIAFLQNRGTDEGIKTACKYYQLAAGTFISLSEKVQAQPQLAGTPDLAASYLSMLQALMLGQAQECFYIKAQRGGMKHAILFKLAYQVFEYYQAAINYSAIPELKTSIHPFWPVFLQFRSAMYAGLGNYHMGLAIEGKYGEQLCYLRRAMQAVNDPNLLKQLKSMQGSLPQDFLEKQATIARVYQAAENDNSKVYYESVPKDLPGIQGKSMVQPIPFKHLELDSDPLKALIPAAVMQFVQQFQERKQQIVAQMAKSVEDQNQIVKQALLSLGLPDSLQAIETPDGIPPGVFENISKFKQQGGVPLLLNQLEVIQTLSRDVSGILKSCTESLNVEEQEDGALRGKYPGRWNRDPSHALNLGLRQEISKYQSNCDHAAKSDEIIRARAGEIQQLLITLSGTESDVQKLIPASDPPDANTVRLVNTLKQHLAQLEKSISERESLLAQVTSLAESDDITTSLIQSPQGSIVEHALTKYRDFEVRLHQNAEAQDTLITTITEVNSSFVQAKNTASGNASRDAAIQKIDGAIRTFSELLKNLNEGTGFYQKFQTILIQLKAKCDQFIATRNAEKNTLVGKLSQAQLGAVPVGGASFNYVPAQYVNPDARGQFQPVNYAQPPPGYYPPPQASTSQAAYPQGSAPQFYTVQGPDGQPQYIPASFYQGRQ